MQRTTIAITGLQNSGKTSFTQRLLTGTYVTPQPTYGVDIEFATYRDYPLQIWDLGGHMVFRKNIWQNYIKQASAFVYIFDASNLDTMFESAEWFWKCFAWIENKGLPVVFLANKWDLVEDKEKTMDKIASGFRLDEMTSKALDSPFRFFFVSVKTGEYISDAMNWLIVKNFIDKKNINTKILTLDLFMKVDQFSIHIHDNTVNRNNSSDIISTYFKKWQNSESNIIEMLEELTYNDLKVFIFSQPNKSIVITTKSEVLDKSIFAQIIEATNNIDSIEDIYSYVNVYENTKQLLINSFQADISNSLSCDIFSDFAETLTN